MQIKYMVNGESAATKQKCSVLHVHRAHTYVYSRVDEISNLFRLQEGLTTHGGITFIPAFDICV